MNNGAIIWMIIFAIAAIGFFLIAAVVAVRGFSDLRLLLRHSGRNDEIEQSSEKTEDSPAD